eukprot:gene21478-27513_t
MKVCCEEPVTIKEQDTTNAHLKARAVYKCGQCGHPKIRPHKCTFEREQASGVSLVSPFVQKSDGHHPHNPFWSAKPNFGLSVSVCEDPMEPPSGGPSRLSRGSGDTSVVTPRDAPLFAFPPQEDVVMLPVSSYSSYDSKSDQLSHDIIYRHNRSLRAKQKKAHVLSKQMAKAATKADNRTFAYTHQSDSENSSATTSTTGWSETVLLNHAPSSGKKPERVPLHKRGRADSDSYVTRNYNSCGFYTSDPQLIRKHLRQIRRQVSESSNSHQSQQYQQYSDHYSNNPSTEEEASSDDTSESEDRVTYRQFTPYENPHCASYVSETRSDDEQYYCTNSQVSAANTITNTVNRISISDLPSETEQQARPAAEQLMLMFQTASLPCETTIVASVSTSPKPVPKPLSASPITLVSKPLLNKQRRLSQVFAAEREMRHSPSPVWPASSPDICSAFRGHNVNRGDHNADSDSDLDEEGDEEVFKYLNDDINSWI